MKQNHYNRILEVISNTENTSKHLPAIRKCILNFIEVFNDLGDETLLMQLDLYGKFYELQRMVLL